MKYTGLPYQIKPGDTLETIAANKLNNPNAWPIILAFNNTPEVIKAGAKQITNPDMIYVGATMMLPIIPGITPAYVKTVTSQMQTMKDQLPNIKLPSTFAYDIKGTEIVLEYPRFRATITLKGRVMLSLDKKTPITSVVNGSNSYAHRKEAETVFGKLMSENSLGYDPHKGTVTYSNKMIMSSHNKKAPIVSLGIEVSSATGPVLKAEFLYREIRGKLGKVPFFANDFRVDVEIQPRIMGPRPPLVRADDVCTKGSHPLLSGKRNTLVNTHGGTDWEEILRNAGTGAVVLAGVITVAYGASLIFSAGATSAAAPAYAGTMSAILVGATVTTVSIQQ